MSEEALLNQAEELVKELKDASLDESLDDEWEEGEEEMFYRDETMNSIILDTGGNLKEVDVTNEEWYKQAMQDAKDFLQCQNEEDEINPVEIAQALLQKDDPPFRREESTLSDEGEWLLEEIRNRKRHKGETYYYCKWKGYAKPTWESEEDLLDEGLEAQVETFLKARKASPSHQPGSLTAKPRRRKEVLAVTYKGRIPTCPPGEFNPETFWSDYGVRIIKAFNTLGWGVTRIQNIVHPDQRRRFTAEWVCKDAGVPVMVFHGTAEHNIPGIVQHGLVVPGSGYGVTVANGSAHGVGIYTSLTPSTPVGYMRGGNYLFVCAALIGPRFTTTRTPGDWVVMFDPAQVLPCFLLELKHIRCLSYPENQNSYQDKYPTYVDDMLTWKVADPTVPVQWPPNPKFPDHQALGFSAGSDTLRGCCSNMAQYYPPICPPKDNEGWESAAKKGLSKRQIKSQARRVKGLYKQGLIRQKKN